MCQQVNGRQWYKLSPDSSGSYINGTWSTLASAMDPRLYFASAVLADGTVFVAGGEYSGGQTEDEILGVERYDPTVDAWSTLTAPPGWGRIGDAPCSVLADGRVLMGSNADAQVSIFDPAANSWSSAAGKLDGNSTEESWTLLPDHSVLAVDCSGTMITAERYVPELDTWEATDQLPVQIVATDGSQEMGPAVLMPDGRVLVVGATGHTALFSTHGKRGGDWAAGPDFPADSSGTLQGGKDAPACLLPNGKVLCAVAPVTANQNDYPGPTSFFEFDGQAFISAPAPPSASGAPFQGCLLLLPTGEVLFSTQSPEIYVYTPDGMPEPDWKPTITDCPRHVTPGQSFTLSGTQLNGRSQAVGYGDDYAAATNYPIVRIERPDGTVRYCRTTGHSTMGVATGSQVVTTQVTVPGDITPGPAQLVVVADGIPSDSFSITVDGALPAAARPAAAQTPLAPAPGRPFLVIGGRTIGQWIGLGLGYVPCGINAACNWTFWAERQSFTTLEKQCTQTRDEGYNQCTQTRDEGYNQCTQTRDEGYNQCTQSRDEGYSQCCTWWPCSWACSAWVWVSNVVCVAWTWISNVVCVAWTWISNVVCVAWTWIQNVVCVAWSWLETQHWFWTLVRRLTCTR